MMPLGSEPGEVQACYLRLKPAVTVADAPLPTAVRVECQAEIGLAALPDGIADLSLLPGFYV